jgi:Golgi phosphoprotein 3 (GPP34)
VTLDTLLVAEDLLLLLTDDRTGKLVIASNQVDIALGGAMLVELALAERVAVAGGAAAVRKGRVIVADAGPTSDVLLDEALAVLGRRQGERPKDVVGPLGKGLRARLDARLANRGLLRERSGKILGVVPTHRWPAVDTTHEDSLRASVGDALRAAATDDAHVGALISLLHAARATEKAVDPRAVGVTKKELKAHAERIADGNWGAEAVRAAIDELTGAMAAAVTSTTIAAGS